MRNVFLVIILLLTGVVIYGVYHDRRLDARLNQVFPQEPESVVKAAMGTPSSVSSPCSAYGTTITLGDCDHVLVYRSFFYSLHPKFWLVFVDAKGLTTATSRQNLP